MNVGHLLRQTISRAASTGVDASGNPTYGTPETLNARVEESPSVSRRGASGAEAESATLVFCDVALSVTDRIWLNGDSTSDTSKARTPMTVERVTDLAGNTVLWKAAL